MADEQHREHHTPADSVRQGSLRRLAGRRRFARAEWLALGLALALHAAAFALVPGPLNNALQQAPQILLSLNLEEPVVPSMDETESTDATATDVGRGRSPSRPAETEAGRGRGPAPTQNSDLQHNGKTPSDVSTLQPVAASASQPEPVEATPDPAQVWAELGDALELRDAGGDPADGEAAPFQEADSDQESPAEEQLAESPDPEQAADIDTEALLREYAANIKALIEAEKFYPAAAERLGHSGTVKIGFTISAKGTVSDIYVKEGSGHHRLDDAAAEAVRRAARFPAIPPGLGRDSLAMSVSLSYSLK